MLNEAISAIHVIEADHRIELGEVTPTRFGCQLNSEEHKPKGELGPKQKPATKQVEILLPPPR